MLLNLGFLICIKERVICAVDGKDMEFENGSAAREYFLKAPGKYESQDIRVKDGTIYILIKDMTDEIEARNKKWIEEEKKRTGEEPSFF